MTIVTELFYLLLENEVIQLPGQPVLQKTKLNSIFAGKYSEPLSSNDIREQNEV